MNTAFGFVAGLLQAALSLLGFVQQHPELPSVQKDEAQHVAQQAITWATQTLLSNKETPFNPFKAKPSSGPSPLEVEFYYPAQQDKEAKMMYVYPGEANNLKGESDSFMICNRGGCTAHHTYEKPGQYTADLYDARSNKVLHSVVVTATDQNSIAVTMVPGMQKYTDSDFGFSFWYPSGWVITTQSPVSTGTYAGGTVTRRIWIHPPMSAVDTHDKGDKMMQSVSIEEVMSPSMSITDATGVGPCPVCVAMRYFFDKDAHAWMLSFPEGTENGKPAGYTQAADTTRNTMGGLHTFSGSRRFGDNVIIPLSTHNFLVVSQGGESRDPSFMTLAKTIVASDPSVATPISAAEQKAVIEAEKKAYAAQ